MTNDVSQPVAKRRPLIGKGVVTLVRVFYCAIILTLLIILMERMGIHVVSYLYYKYKFETLSTDEKVEAMIRASTGCGTCAKGYDLVTSPLDIPEIGDAAIPKLKEALSWKGARSLSGTYSSVAAVSLWNLGDNGKQVLYDYADGNETYEKWVAVAWLAVLEGGDYRTRLIEKYRQAPTCEELPAYLKMFIYIPHEMRSIRFLDDDELEKECEDRMHEIGCEIYDTVKTKHDGMDYMGWGVSLYETEHGGE